jgi:CRISPR-associated endonuclease/helicase Cas3
MFHYWGKADPNYAGEQKWHPLVYHSLDVAAVGVEYLRRAPSVRVLLMRGLRIENEKALEAWVALWLTLHDLGKFSEAFQSQRPDLVQELRGRAPDSNKSYRLRHDSLGMLFWQDVLCQRVVDESWFGPETERALDGIDCWVRAVTGHHGQPPKVSGEFWEQHFDRRQDRVAILEFVAEVRSLLVSDAVAAIPTTQDFETFHRSSMELSWWIAGLAVLADWLGSNTDFFRYCAAPDHPSPLADYWERAAGQAVAALDAAGVSPVRSERTLSFAELFPGIAVPSPLQNWVAATYLPHGPQIYLLEDVTGAGKTEAAVTLAHRLMAAGCADGFFIGLPTMATANAMYGRIAKVYAKLFSERASLALAHGQRNLVEAFAASVIPPGPSEEDAQQADETATARCTAWLADHNKRALLAPAGVGTLDQALLAVLHSRHQSLRLLGLFRKVLVVDEVHACDAYMQGVLETLLEFHAHAGGSAILLSATLPKRMRQALLNAFARGCRLPAPETTAQTYPLVTQWHRAIPDALVEKDLPTRDDVRRALAVHYVCSEEEVIAAIEPALANGKCVCWMRNTVSDALAAYARFKDRLPATKLTLFHARFALRDRLSIERQILEDFGPDSTPVRRRGQLVIATQVAEQSLDADWDFVVSDLAPIDRLIQRAGRLQRHPRDEHGERLRDPEARDRRGAPCLWVFGPMWVGDPPARWFKAAFPKASGVYPHHGQLWLTAKALRVGRIVMPDDARQLIESVFGDDTVLPEGLQSNANVAEGRGYADASVAQQNTVKLATGYVRGGMDWWSEAKTPSRLGEASMNVLLACWEGDRLRPWAEGPHGWAYSSVRVAERLIARAAEPSSPARKTAVEQLLQTLPNKGRWSVLLPLDETPRGWVGDAWSAPTSYKAERLLKWVYDPLTGLRQIDVTATQDEEGE